MNSKNNKIFWMVLGGDFSGNESKYNIGSDYSENYWKTYKRL